MHSFLLTKSSKVPHKTADIKEQQLITITMNKEECLEFLKSLKSKVKHFRWDGQAAEYELIDSEYLKSYLDLFEFPYNEDDITDCSNLPKNWLVGMSEDNEEYQAVLKVYSEVHDMIWHNGSSESEYNCLATSGSSNAELNAEYWRLVKNR